mgnify:CR=1 FL=1
MADPSRVDCKNCGAPLGASEPNCRYCGKGIEGRTGRSNRSVPVEVASATERLRLRLGTPDALLDHLAEELRRVLPRSAVQISRARLGGGRRLQVRVGTIAYTFRQEGSGMVVERQSVAGGFAVGMKDVLPASRWPEQLVRDVAENADATGQDWRATIAKL